MPDFFRSAMPRVFISYSWDSPEHKERVRKLATFLREQGIDAHLDQWEQTTPSDGWPAWCSRQVKQADCIVVVCTEQYHDRFHGLTQPRQPGGVRWESTTIQNLLYFHYLRAAFLPIVLREADGQYVPACVLGAVVKPLVWPSDGDWAATGIVEKLDGQGPPRRSEPLPIPSHAPASAADAPNESPSLIDDEIWKGIAGIQERLSIIEGALQQPYRLNLDRPDLKRSDAHDPSIHNLHYSQRWLDFQSRPELDQLHQWVADKAAFSWWAVIAPGGTGKSRLALELIHSLDAELWDAGFLTDSFDATWLADKCQGWRPQRPTLLVVDYANARQEAVIKGLETLSHTLRDDALFPRVRLLLLDRAAGFAPGFAIHNEAFRTWNNIRDRVRRNLYQPERVPRPEMRLTNETPPLVEQDELLKLQDPPLEEWPAILTVVIGKATPPGEVPVEIDHLTDANWWDHADRLTARGRMLYLELLGVVLARNPQFITGSTGPVSTEDLLDAMLDRERNVRWLKEWPASLPCPIDWANSAELKTLTRTIGFATLVRGIPIATENDWQPVEEATQLPGEWHGLLDSYLRVDSIPPAKNGSGKQVTIDVIQPLEPDLLGERLLLRLSSPTGTGRKARSPDVSPASWIGPAFNCNSVGTAQTLNLLADDFPDHPATQAWVNAALKYLVDQFPAGEDDEWREVTAYGLGSAVSKLAIRDGFCVECRDNLISLAATAEEIRLLLLIGFMTQSKRACRLSNQAWDELAFNLAWATISRESRTKLMIAELTVNILADYGRASRMDEIERWAAAMQQAARTDFEVIEIQLRLANAAFNTITVYGTARQFPDLERWGATLTNLASAHPEAAEIQLRLAEAAVNAITVYGTAGQFPDLERWGATLAAALAQSPVTPDFMGQALATAGSLLQRCPEGGARLLTVLTSYWPGYVLNLAEDQRAPLCIVLADGLSDSAAQHHRELLAKAYSLLKPFTNGDVQTITAAVPLLRELWPLRMYLSDRGDGLVPMLGKCGLDDLVAEAAWDPWRRSADPSRAGD
ncbi:MAG: hypothetical protein RLZZ326_3046 [Planctomycetota bacterium]